MASTWRRRRRAFVSRKRYERDAHPRADSRDDHRIRAVYLFGDHRRGTNARTRFPIRRDTFGSNGFRSTENRRTNQGRQHVRGQELEAESPTLIGDTLRLALEAEAIVVAHAAVIERLHPDAVTVLFQYSPSEIVAMSVSRPEMWPITFVRGADGQFIQEKRSKQPLKLVIKP
jgi:hypothetical protein